MRRGDDLLVWETSRRHRGGTTHARPSCGPCSGRASPCSSRSSSSRSSSTWRSPAVAPSLRLEGRRAGRSAHPGGEVSPVRAEGDGARSRDGGDDTDALRLLATVDLADHEAAALDHLGGPRTVDPPARLAIGNPIVFWGSIWALPYLAWSWAQARLGSGVHPDGGPFQYLPWFPASRPQFFFYVAPFTPFLVRGRAHGARPPTRLVVRSRGRGRDRSGNGRTRSRLAAVLRPVARGPWSWPRRPLRLVLAGAELGAISDTAGTSCGSRAGGRRTPEDTKPGALAGASVLIRISES